MELYPSKTGSAWGADVMAHAHKEWDKLEKILLTIVSGTLAISITFLNIRTFPATSRDLLFLSWLFLFISLLSLLTSYIFGELSASGILKFLKKNSERQITSSEIDKLERNFYRRGIDWSNLTTVTCGIVGLLFLALSGLNYAYSLG